MKKILAATLLSAVTSVALAHDDVLGGNPDLYGSPLLDHTAGATGEPMKGDGDLYGSFLANPEFLRPDPNARVEPWDRSQAWRSRGDLYQSVLLDGQI